MLEQIGAHHAYAPGLYGLSDFSGKRLALRTGRGERDVEIFVTVLAHSQLIYAEAVPDQKIRHWTMVHRRALEYFGGVPERWIIDNLKSGVDKPDREEPQLNPSFREFARHYNVAVLPARSGRATDKGGRAACGARRGAGRGAGAHRHGLGRAVCREAGEGSAGRRRVRSAMRCEPTATRSGFWTRPPRRSSSCASGRGLRTTLAVIGPGS